jgi:hypothetical protein
MKIKSNIAILKNAVFWDVALCSSCVNRISEDSILHSHRCENLNSYIIDFIEGK